MKFLIGKLKALFFEVKDHWKTPKEGEYVPYKEFAIFCAGASGNNAFQSLVTYVTFAASCLLVGTIYNIEFMHIATIGLVGMPFAFIFQPMYMNIQDNLGNLEGKTKIVTHSICIPLFIIGVGCYFVPQGAFEQFLPALPQILGTILTTSVFNVYYKILTYKLLSKRFGKFICWVVSGCIPSFIMFCLLLFLPFNDMLYYNKLWALHLCFSMFNIFIVFIGQVPNIQNVLSPNTNERAKLMSIGATVFSLVPSVLSMFLPALMQIAGTFQRIESYRIVFPILGAIFAALTLLLAFGVKERVILEKAHKARVPFFQGFKAVIKNKYYWITNLSGVPNLLLAGGIALANVLFIYVSRQEWLLGVYAGITGTAYIPGMLLAPWLIKKLGKRKITIIARSCQIVAGIAIAFSATIGSIPLFILFNYIALFTNAPTVVVGAAITADIWDYQQYKTGERLDGCSQIFPLLMTPIATFGAYIIPTIYEKLHFTSDWDIMFIPELRNPIIWASAIAGAIGGVVGLVPWFFYDLTEKKHVQMMDELKRRAAIADGMTEEEYDAMLLQQAEEKRLAALALDDSTVGDADNVPTADGGENVDTSTIDEPTDEGGKTIDDADTVLTVDGDTPIVDHSTPTQDDTDNDSPHDIDGIDTTTTDSDDVDDKQD